MKAYTKGIEAKKQGKTLQDCPYGTGTLFRKMWMKGYAITASINGAKETKASIEKIGIQAQLSANEVDKFNNLLKELES